MCVHNDEALAVCCCVHVGDIHTHTHTHPFTHPPTTPTYCAYCCTACAAAAIAAPSAATLSACCATPHPSSFLCRTRHCSICMGTPVLFDTTTKGSMRSTCVRENPCPTALMCSSTSVTVSSPTTVLRMSKGWLLSCMGVGGSGSVERVSSGGGSMRRGGVQPPAPTLRRTPHPVRGGCFLLGGGWVWSETRVRCGGGGIAMSCTWWCTRKHHHTAHRYITNYPFPLQHMYTQTHKHKLPVVFHQQAKGRTACRVCWVRLFGCQVGRWCCCEYYLVW